MKHPRMIEIGTLSCYFSIDDLKQISEALWIAREDYGKTDWSESDQEEYLDLQERVVGYIKQYERRMKDGS